MADTRPTDIMEREHRVIEKVVAAMAVLADRLEAGHEIEPGVLTDIVDFMRGYADRCHHGKEEARLFPVLISRGVPQAGCPIGALTQEHTMGRAMVGELEAAAAAYSLGRPQAGESAAKALRALVALYPGHIWKEDYLLFPMTNKVLGDEDQAHLCADLAAADLAFGRETIERYERFAETIREHK